MRLCRFDAGAGARHGILQDGCVVDREEPTVRHSLEEVRLLAPVQPRKFLAIGLNYADHIAESGMEAPQYPVFFNKQVTWRRPTSGRREVQPRRGPPATEAS